MTRLAHVALLVLMQLPAACAGDGDAAPAATGSAPSLSIGGTTRAFYGRSW